MRVQYTHTHTHTQAKAHTQIHTVRILLAYWLVDCVVVTAQRQGCLMSIYTYL